MKNIRSIIILLSFSIAVLLTSCGTETFNSKLTTEPPGLDGSLNEWQNVETYATSDSAFVAQFMNDSDYLYMAVEVRDRPIQLMLRRFGLVTWYSPGGGKSKRYALRLPASTIAEFDQSRGGFWYAYIPEQQREAERKLSSYRDGVFLMNTAQRAWQVYPQGTNAPFALAAMNSRGRLVMELQLPLNYSDEVIDADLSDDESRVGLGVRLPQLPGDRNGTFGGAQVMQSGRQGQQSGPGSIRMTEIWWEVQLADR